MQFGAGPTDLYSAYQQQQPEQPQITPWVAQRMQNAGAGQMPPQGAPMAQPGQAAQPAMDPQTAAKVRQMQQAGMTQDEIKALMGLHETRTQSAEAQRQRALAKELRGGAQDQFKGRDTGKFYVGPTWVNLLASVAQQRRAGQEEAGAKETEADIIRKRQAALEPLSKAEPEY